MKLPTTIRFYYYQEGFYPNYDFDAHIHDTIDTIFEEWQTTLDAHHQNLRVRTLGYHVNKMVTAQEVLDCLSVFVHGVFCIRVYKRTGTFSELVDQVNKLEDVTKEGAPKSHLALL